LAISAAAQQQTGATQQARGLGDHLKRQIRALGDVEE
jgi:hypothetical protein